MKRRRVDWDEELRKTEQIRRRGFFISGLSFGVAAIFIFGASRMSENGIVLGRKVVFTLCFLIAMFLFRLALRRRARLRRAMEEDPGPE